jgi:hypothetical protein
LDQRKSAPYVQPWVTCRLTAPRCCVVGGEGASKLRIPLQGVDIPQPPQGHLEGLPGGVVAGQEAVQLQGMPDSWEAPHEGASC